MSSLPINVLLSIFTFSTTNFVFLDLLLKFINLSYQFKKTEKEKL